jgi:hypothetical protein
MSVERIVFMSGTIAGRRRVVKLGFPRLATLL